MNNNISVSGLTHQLNAHYRLMQKYRFSPDKEMYFMQIGAISALNEICRICGYTPELIGNEYVLTPARRA